MFDHYAQCNAGCRVLFIITLSVIILSFVILGVVMLSVVMRNAIIEVIATLKAVI
jgi:hypothetical protein